MINAGMRKSLALAFAAILAVFAGGLLYRPLLTNIAYLGFTRLYLSPLPAQQDRQQLLHTTLRYACRASLIHACDELAGLSTKSLLDIVDETFTAHTSPLRLIALTEEPLVAQDFSINGDSIANRTVVDSDKLVLWGNGFLTARLFVFDESDWRITVNAIHDDPPPVLLSIELDRQEIAQFAYGRGDQSWEAQTTPSVRVQPGYHTLNIRYINDNFDTQQKLDRNAYFGQISISNSPTSRYAER